METALNADHVKEISKLLEENSVGNASLTDIMQLAETMAQTFKGLYAELDTTIFEDFQDIASEIAEMKADIADLRPGELRQQKIPEAGKELDAVVKSTENATDAIMTAAEDIMGADTSDSEAYVELVNGKMIEIFEACSFQDITGQRISKVVKTLNFIDERVNALIERLKMTDLVDTDHKETSEEKRDREQILHGPQFDGVGVDQSDVDALLNSGNGGSSQDDIDNLFD
ncbi:MAG: chemotaxis protein [Hyphomicrobiales bacterium]|nr:MAG: chemotaxis protein [Hyphomicrobiales bacterium]